MHGQMWMHVLNIWLLCLCSVDSRIAYALWFFLFTSIVWKHPLFHLTLCFSLSPSALLLVKGAWLVFAQY